MKNRNKVEPNDAVEPDAQAEDIAPKSVKVTNSSTVDLIISGTPIASGKTETVKDFDPENAMNKAWIDAKMISVE